MTCILGARENIPGFFFPKIIIFFQKVNKFNAYNKAFHPILGLYEVPSTVFAPEPLVV